MMVQWMHGYGLAPGDLRMMVKTFRTAFPATAVWNTTPGDYLLVGREASVPVDLDELKRRVAAVPGLQEDLSRVGFRSAPAILSDFLLGDGDATSYSSTASLNTDDHLRLQFSAPLSLYRDTAQLNERLLRGYQTKEFPARVEEHQHNHSRIREAYGVALPPFAAWSASPVEFT